ncbi:MAG: pyridoxal-phosphate dependent enzyme [Planctomycetes bacterium]|nr:pyridoxal-phosphate dependent enzyme [Planctomycetota bacterium]
MAIHEPQRIPLAALPTPLVHLPRLGRELDDAQIWMKRDDLTGLEVSGNKIRKLEYVIADAQASACDTLVTEGTCQSNHCRAVAAACARVGLHSFLLFRPEAADSPQGNHLLDVLFGAETRSYSRIRFDGDHDQIINDVIAELLARGRQPRYTPAGASEPLGCWGYIRATAELADQLQAAGIGECDVVVPLSSGGTYAGTLVGKLLHRLDHWRLWAVPVSDDVAYHQYAVGRLCRAAIAQYGLPIDFDDAALRLVDGYVGQGYAIPYSKAIETIQLLARFEGIMLDPVYTGKSFCAVLDGVREGRFGRERPVVFIHTGGVFSDFAWPEVILQGLPRN